MENLLPTLTIIMAEVALVLLVLLIVLLYRYGAASVCIRPKSRH